MVNVGVIDPNRTERITTLASELRGAGYFCVSYSSYDSASTNVPKGEIDAVLLAIDGKYTETGWSLAYTLKEQYDIPVIPLLTPESLADIDSKALFDDFVLEPWNGAEVIVRLKRILKQAGPGHSDNYVKHGDLLIDFDGCEVWVDDRLIPLTYKEYELLKFLIGSPGRVFDRDTILNKVWGFDYFGGDRTVDVHIRRLRSKIEDHRHSFIDTVRNVGYRFRKDI